MSELTAPPPSLSAPEAGDDSLDARIWRAEQRLIAREQRFRERLQTVSQRVQRAVQPQRLLVPAAGVAAGLLALVWLMRGRRAPARAVSAAAAGQANDEMQPQAGGVPWVRLLGLAWPMLPARWRDRMSPATASTLLGVGIPLIEKLLARRRAPPRATKGAVDLERLAGNWIPVAQLPQPLHGERLPFSSWSDVLQALPMALSDRWVLHVDDAYTELLLGSPSRDQLWLLSRHPHLPPQRLRALVQIAQDRGFAVERLTFGDER